MNKKEVGISEKPVNDPNFLAFQQALEKGDFNEFEAGTYVAFHDGELVGTGSDVEKLIQELSEQGKHSFLKQVNVPERVLHIRSPRLVRD